MLVAFVIGGVFFDIYGQGIYGSDDDAATVTPLATAAAEAGSPAPD